MFITVRIGDTPMSIARSFTGDSDRYTELVKANPQVPTVMIPGPGNASNFAEYAWKEGLVLNMPKSWTPLVQS